MGMDIITAAFAAATLYSTAVLALTYWRIQDRRIKTYTKWVVLSIGAVFATLFLGGGELIVIPAILWLYCSNRSVGSLAIRTKTLPA
jgi:phosphoglycerol transferase MdoB-like AlkP superfamily enzyme